MKGDQVLAFKRQSLTPSPWSRTHFLHAALFTISHYFKMIPSYSKMCLLTFS